MIQALTKTCKLFKGKEQIEIRLKVIKCIHLQLKASKHEKKSSLNISTQYSFD